jgi:tetratricopeptide (TPR) repeat protein
MRHALSALLVIGLAFTACKEDPADTHQRLAIDLFAKGEWAKAAAEYEEVIKLKPDLDEMVQKKAASAWAKAGEYDKAAAILERLGSKKTGEDKLNATREIAGMYLQTAHDLDKSEAWFQKALAMNPKDEQSLSWLAEISSVRGGARNAAVDAKTDQLDEALKRYDAVLALNPTSVAAWVNKRIVYMKYLEALQKKRTAALADAEANKADKETAGDFKKTADEAQAKWDELKVTLDEVSKKIGELNKAAAAAKK